METRPSLPAFGGQTLQRYDRRFHRYSNVPELSRSQSDESPGVIIDRSRAFDAIAYVADHADYNEPQHHGAMGEHSRNQCPRMESLLQLSSQLALAFS